LAAGVPAALGVIGLGLLVGAAAYVINAYPTMQPWPALGAWAGSIALFLVGAWALTSPGRAIRLARWELAALAGLTLLALALRAVAIERIPQNFGGDEGEMGRLAREVLHGTAYAPFATGWLSHPMLWFFLQALALRSFGDNVFGLRMLSALVGTATIPAMYLFARPLYGRAIALGAAALLAAYHFHIHFSRLGVNNVVDPLAALVVFGTFLYAYRARSAFGFALAGVLMGVAQHFYMGTRLIPVVVGVALLHQLAFDWRRVWELRWQIVLIGLGLLVGIGPLLGFFISHPQDFTARLGMVGIFQTGWFEQQRAGGASALAILGSQVGNSFGAWTFLPDRSAWYDPHIPLLDRVSSVFFLIGAIATLARLRRLEAALLAAWMLGVAVFGGILLVNSPESPRYVMSAAPICLLVMLGAEQVGKLLAWVAPRAPRLAWRVAGAVLVIGLSLWSVNFYFREYTPRATYGWFNTEAATAIGRYLRSEPEPVYVYFYGPPVMFLANGTIRFEAPGTLGMDVEPNTRVEQLPPAPAGLRPIFIFMPWRIDDLAPVRARYPTGALRQFEAQSQDTPLLVIYTPQ
jgi:hypothetical protein